MSKINKLRDVINEEVKKVLKEDNQEREKAKKLHQYLQEDYINSLKNHLYRGYSEEIETFKVKKIRKDRKPSDTPMYLQLLVDKMAEEYGPVDIPKRSESKFASAKKSFAKSFGSLYICFPEHDAKLVSAKYDTWEQTLSDVEALFSEAIRELSDKEYNNINVYKKYPKLTKGIQFLEDILNSVKSNFIEKRRNKVHKLWNFYKQNKKEIKKQGELSGIEEFHDAFQMIKVHYLGGFNERINEDDEEIMFDGDTYLLVDPRFFNRYFKWDRMYGNWKIKSQYR